MTEYTFLTGSLCNICIGIHVIRMSIINTIILLIITNNANLTIKFEQTVCWWVLSVCEMVSNAGSTSWSGHKDARSANKEQTLFSNIIHSSDTCGVMPLDFSHSPVDKQLTWFMNFNDSSSKQLCNSECFSIYTQYNGRYFSLPWFPKPRVLSK